MAKRTHGASTTRAYSVWYHMKRRCLDPNNKSFKNYGGRGIKVCDRWLIFENFLADMGQPPENLEIERVDNNADYCPANCRWADRLDQSNNRRYCRPITLNGVTKNISQWCTHLGLNRRTVISRITRGFPVEKILSTEKFVNHSGLLLGKRFTTTSHCKHGHQLSGENVRILKSGQKQCQECNRRRAREWYQKHRAKKPRECGAVC